MSLPNPVTRKEQYLNEIATGEHTKPSHPITREEMYLDAIAEGGGSGGTTNYNNLENRPQINGNTLEGNMSFANLGIDETPTEDSTNAVASGGVYAGLADKIDKSSTGYETITGNPIEFDSPSPQIVGMKCDIVPTQDLHGYDKPWAGGEGKNKLSLVLADIKAANTTGTWSGNVYTISGATFTINTDNNDNVISIIGVGNGSGGNTLSLPFTLSAGSYILSSGFVESNGANDTFLQNNEATIARGNSGSPGQSFTLASDTNVIWHFRVTSNTQYICTPMIRLATETDPTFEPYTNICPISGVDTINIDVTGGESYTIDLDGTRYGGQLDVTSGVLTLTHGEIASYDGETLPSEWISDRDEYQAGTTPTTGAQVVYKLATPQTVQLTPTRVWAVQGGNTITVSVDGVEAEIHSSAYATLKDIEILYNMIKGG